MKPQYILLCLTLFCYGYSVVVLQSTPTSVSIISPTGLTAVYSTFYNAKQSGKAGAGILWITSSKATTPIYYTYRSLFYSSCIGNANLTITAASYFFAYLDGVYLGYGSNSSAIYRYSVKIKCGSHNLTILVYTVKNVNQGLTFALNQDQSACYNCQAPGAWNENICECTCITNGCTCTAPKVWRGYPFCGCGCPVTSILVTLAGRFRPVCTSPKYYSAFDCGCLCHSQYCPDGYYFSQTQCKCLSALK